MLYSFVEQEVVIDLGEVCTVQKALAEVQSSIIELQSKDGTNKIIISFKNGRELNVPFETPEETTATFKSLLEELIKYHKQ